MRRVRQRHAVHRLALEQPISTSRCVTSVARVCRDLEHALLVEGGSNALVRGLGHRADGREERQLGARDRTVGATANGRSPARSCRPGLRPPREMILRASRCQTAHGWPKVRGRARGTKSRRGRHFILSNMASASMTALERLFARHRHQPRDSSHAAAARCKLSFRRQVRARVLGRRRSSSSFSPCAARRR